MSSLKLKLSLTAAAVLLAGCSLPSDGPTEETIMQRQVEAHENVQIQLSNRVSALEQELQGVEGKIEELNHSIQQLVARQQDLYQQIDSLNGRNGNSGASSDNSSDSSSDSSSDNSSAGGSEASDYQNAVSLINKDKNYSAAKNSLEKVKSDYPKSSYISNVEFWLGMCELRLGNQDAAKDHFSYVVKDKNATKRGDSLYQLGKLYESKGQKDKASKFYEIVMIQYPNTAIADTAKKAKDSL